MKETFHGRSASMTAANSGVQHAIRHRVVTLKLEGCWVRARDVYVYTSERFGTGHSPRSVLSRALPRTQDRGFARRMTMDESGGVHRDFLHDATATVEVACTMLSIGTSFVQTRDAATRVSICNGKGIVLSTQTCKVQGTRRPSASHRT